MTKTLAIKGFFALSVSGALVAITPGIAAFAGTACGAGGTEITPGVCEIKFTSAGSHVFTPTPTMTKIDALVVGAGGQGSGSISAHSSYAGGGGDVKLVTLTNMSQVTAFVGANDTGAYSSLLDSVVSQGTTVTTATGANRSTSGNGLRNLDRFTNGVFFGAGAGAGGAPDSASTNGGPGIVVNSISGAQDTLFANDTTCYGGGGSSSAFFENSGNRLTIFSGESVCGGGGLAIVTDPDQVFLSYTLTPTRANSGSGGASYFRSTRTTTYGLVSQDGEVSQDGAAGIVIIRYQDPGAPALANTGTGGLGETFAAAFALLGLGVGALAVRRRRS